MIVVADASPLIFLAKVRRLQLVTELFGHDIRVPRLVREEILRPDSDPVERDALESFLGSCSVEAVRRPRVFAHAMSAADNAALTLAMRAGADLLLCDDRLTRAVAEREGVRAVGTLGVLLRSMASGHLARQDVRSVVDTLIRSHAFRVSIEVYQAVLAEIERR